MNIKGLSAGLGAGAVVAMGLLAALNPGSQAAASVEPPAATVTRTVETTLKIAFASPTHTATLCAKRQTMPCN
jgi:hypothetical protein